MDTNRLRIRTRFRLGERVKWRSCEIPGPSTGQTEPIPAGTGDVIYVSNGGLNGVVRPHARSIRDRIEEIWRCVEDEVPAEWRGCLCFDQDLDEPDDFWPERLQ